MSRISSKLIVSTSLECNVFNKYTKYFKRKGISFQCHCTRKTFNACRILDLMIAIPCTIRLIFLVYGFREEMTSLSMCICEYQGRPRMEDLIWNAIPTIYFFIILPHPSAHILLHMKFILHFYYSELLNNYYNIIPKLND